MFIFYIQGKLACIIKMANSHFLLKNDLYTLSCMQVLKNLAGIFSRGKSTKHELMRREAVAEAEETAFFLRNCIKILYLNFKRRSIFLISFSKVNNV